MQHADELRDGTAIIVVQTGKATVEGVITGYEPAPRPLAVSPNGLTVTYRNLATGELGKAPLRDVFFAPAKRPNKSRAPRVSLGTRTIKRILMEGDADLTGCITAGQALQREWETVPLSDATVIFQTDDGSYVTCSLEMSLRKIKRSDIFDTYGIDPDELDEKDEA